LEQLKGEIARLRAMKTENPSMFATTERGLQDQIFDLMDERNSYKAELEHFYALPNPCGVGLQLQGPKEIVDFSTSGTNTHATLVTVIDIIPGMSAAQCGVIALDDKVLQVDGMPSGGKTPEEIKAIIAGKRGTRVRLTFKRTGDLSEYTVVLKRGAWGPEHVVFGTKSQDPAEPLPRGGYVTDCWNVLQCAASPEQLDMVDQGSWPPTKSRNGNNKALYSNGTSNADY